MIKALIFDLGGVLVPFDFQRGYRALEELCGLPAVEIPKRIGSTDLVRRFECGQIPPRPFFEELSALLGMAVTYEQFCELWTSIFLPATLVSENLLATLAERYRLVLLSNTNPIHYEMIEATYTILRPFHERVLSYRVGAMKPSPIIYEAAIDRAGCRPQECFFTDDIPAYVEGACEAGIDAVQFHSAGQLEADLRARGVLW